MIDIKAIERNEMIEATGLGFTDSYRNDLKNRGDDPQKLDQLLELNQKRKTLVNEAETQRAEQNQISKEVAKRKQVGEDATELLNQLQSISSQVKKAMAEADQTTRDMEELLLNLPNRCHHSTPVGAGEDDNVEVHKKGEPKKFSFSVKDHADLGESLDIIDFERAGKVSGARFAFLKGMGSRLERALIQWMLDLHSSQHGYTEMIPPFLVNSDSMMGTGQLPKFAEDSFVTQNMGLYLVPTAEVPVTNYYAKEILKESDLPQKFAAYTPCFRSEAGSYGKDTKGLFRQHQFNKVELMIFAHPDQSYEVHEQLTQNAEKVLDLLEIPYRRMALCTKDISFSAAKCFDIEVWLPGQNKYREISSCSNFEDFQARRASIRFRPEGPKAKPQYVHTLNGSGLAVGRTLIAILENYQNEDGSVDIPQVLQPYMMGLKRIEARK